jgi:nucleoside 2-deoxyribosyltransferase
MNKPKVVCLCGSTRFYQAFMRANYDETMAGRIVLSVAFMPGPEAAHGETFGCTPEQKIKLDELHLRRIDLADEILVLNVDGYIGESTSREMAYAIATGKKLRFLGPDAGEAFLHHNSHDLGAQVAEFATALVAKSEATGP